jgi:hypothetical protein
MLEFQIICVELICGLSPGWISAPFANACSGPND